MTGKEHNHMKSEKPAVHTLTVHITLQDNEYKNMKEQCDKLHLSQTAYIKNLILNNNGLTVTPHQRACMFNHLQNIYSNSSANDEIKNECTQLYNELQEVIQWHS